MRGIYDDLNLESGVEIYKACIEQSRNSDCDKRKFGSLIVANQRQLVFGRIYKIVLGFGTNYTAGTTTDLNTANFLKVDFNCCKERSTIPSGTRTEYCRAIHAEMAALQMALRSQGRMNTGDWEISLNTLYIAGLNGDRSQFDNSKGFYCLPCAKELIQAGVEKIALASAETPKTGVWSIRTINLTLRESLEFTRGTKIV